MRGAPALTDGGSGSDKVGLLAGLALASSVDGGHSEGVLQALNEAGTRVLCCADHCVVGLDPEQAVSLLPLDVVASDGAAPVALWFLPGHKHAVLVCLVDAAVKGLVWNLYW